MCIYIYIYECKTFIQRTHLFVGHSRNVFGFKVGHFSSQTNLIDLKSFYLTQPIALSVVCIALLLHLLFWMIPTTLFMTQPN